MDADLKKKLDNLEERIAYQEKIHPDITFTKEGFTHGVIQNITIIVLTTVAATCFAVVLYAKLKTK